MTSWSWPWTSPTMTTDWSGRGSTRTRLGSWWSPEAAVMTSRWTTGAGSTVGSWSAGRWREHQSRVEVSPATQSRVSRPSSGHSTGRGRRGGSGGGSAAAAAPLGCDMACDGFDALGLDFSPLFAVLSLFLHFFFGCKLHRWPGFARPCWQRRLPLLFSSSTRLFQFALGQGYKNWRAAKIGWWNIPPVLVKISKIRMNSRRNIRSFQNRLPPV
jgi:hypothetical protein